MTRRTQIRNDLAAALTGLPLVGAHVFIARRRALGDHELPAILVFSGESEAGEGDTDGESGEERWRLRADVLVRDGAGNEAIADDILAAMRNAVVNAAALHDGQTECRYVGAGEVDLDDSTQKPALRLPVLFEVTYL